MSKDTSEETVLRLEVSCAETKEYAYSGRLDREEEEKNWYHYSSWTKNLA